MANGRPSWQPNKRLRQMEKDLELLLIFLMQPEDILLVRELPPDDYLQMLPAIGKTPPQFFPIQSVTTDINFQLLPKDRLRPWGWSPASHRLLEPLKKSCSSEFQNSPVFNWKPEHKEISSRKFALEILKKIPVEISLPPELLPKICKTRKDIEDCIARWGKVMIKAPWSSSGRGLQRITKFPVIEKVWEKLLGIINEQGYAIAEPLLDKVLDMAFQFRAVQGKIEYLGISRFFTDGKGQYQGNFLNGWHNAAESSFFPRIESEVAQYAETLSGTLPFQLIRALGNSEFTRLYEGNFGVDILIFRDENGKLQVNPCLEINVRQNMGLLSLHFEKVVTPGKTAVFKTFYQPGKSFSEFIKEMKSQFPLRIKDFSIDSGFFPLTPVRKDSQFGAYILVAE